MTNKKTGFTLAEVLITLGIIGVVAAMTIPTLIANTNSSKFATQFKKSLSTLNQAALMATAQHDMDYGTLTGKGADGSTAATCDSSETLEGGVSSICALFNETLSGATHVADITGLTSNGKTYSVTYKALTGKNVATATNDIAYQLADGSMVVVPKAMAGCTAKSDACLGYIDVNGATLPNKEVTCETADDTKLDNAEGYATCTVPKDSAHMTDIYPVWFYDQTVEPATNAAKAVLTGGAKATQQGE